MATNPQNMGISPPGEMAIIGRLPGYNSNIDVNGQFVSQLLKGLTFIDLIPATYKLNPSFYTGFNADSFINVLSSTESPFIHESGGDAERHFKKILQTMDDGLGLGSDFTNVSSIRILGANDSTFTESFSNNFDGVKTGNQSINALKGSRLGQAASRITDAYKSMNYEAAMNAFTNDNYGSTVGDILKGSAMGVNFSSPSPWSASSYSSNLTMFIKLVSPSGHSECIKKNIIAPIMYLLAAGNPITARGFAYGFPMIWDVHAHGITRFKIGAISNMTLSRGSFETTFNDKYQPTVIDVRLNIVPLVQDFAVPYSDSSLYTKDSKLGTQTPGDIFNGSMNQFSSTGNTTPEVKIIQL